MRFVNEKPKFRPLTAPTFLNPIFMKLKIEKDICDATQHAEFGSRRLAESSSGKEANFGVLLSVFLFFVFLSPFSCHIVRLMTAQNACFRVR